MRSQRLVVGSRFAQFHDVFNVLPFAAVVDEKIFCIHAGLSPDLDSPEQIKKIMRPTDVPDSGILCDLLWSDPEADISGWAENDRGVSYTFGADVVTKFLQKHDYDLVVRAHQVVEDGFEFFANRQLVTVFTAPNCRPGPLSRCAGAEPPRTCKRSPWRLRACRLGCPPREKHIASFGSLSCVRPTHNSLMRHDATVLQLYVHA